MMRPGYPGISAEPRQAAGQTPDVDNLSLESNARSCMIRSLMDWKRWPYWLRGGLITFGLFYILCLSYYFFAPCKPEGYSPCIPDGEFTMFGFIILLVLGISKSPEIVAGPAKILFVIFQICVVFAAGAMTGLLVQWVRNREHDRPTQSNRRG